MLHSTLLISQAPVCISIPWTFGFRAGGRINAVSCRDQVNVIAARLHCGRTAQMCHSSCASDRVNPSSTLFREETETLNLVRSDVAMTRTSAVVIKQVTRSRTDTSPKDNKARTIVLLACVFASVHHLFPLGFLFTQKVWLRPCTLFRLTKGSALPSFALLPVFLMIWMNLDSLQANESIRISSGCCVKKRAFQKQTENS